MRQTPCVYLYRTESALKGRMYSKGIPAGKIRQYGFALEGKTVLIGQS